MSEPRADAVLDASAVLAYLQAEPGAELVRELLRKGTGWISAVNWAEVLSKAADIGRSPSEVDVELRQLGLLGVALQIVSFDHDALEVGELRSRTKHLGLSLGDRACLALGRRLRHRIMTTDRAWKSLEENLGIEVQILR